jgi:hypothetical protein
MIDLRPLFATLMFAVCVTFAAFHKAAHISTTGEYALIIGAVFSFFVFAARMSD